ncbi:hypothetical protein BKA70DRAFT_1445348 [Coprinopsis sp. MPI-PUGE-AT-0042]|nr:hypothetical protein BKA70DRAFT_1445348 [Coprinopsis sp. MPI-PUGE-AT-0042]
MVVTLSFFRKRVWHCLNSLSRIGGIFWMISRAMHVHTSVVFLFAVICVVLLMEEPRGTPGPEDVEK